MSETPPLKTKHKLARIYGAGILAFTFIVGFITLAAKFLASIPVT
jgi:hypothetical protein